MKKTFLILVIVILGFIIGCNSETPIENYKGYIVVEKSSGVKTGNLYKLKFRSSTDTRFQYQYSFKTVRLVKYDYDRYCVGDTIK